MILLIAAWLLTYLAHSTLLLCVACLVTKALSVRHEQWAEPIWRTALVAGVLSATVCAVVPDLRGGVQLTLVGATPAVSASGSLWPEYGGDREAGIGAVVSGIVVLWLSIALYRTTALFQAYRLVRRSLARRITIDHSALSSRDLVQAGRRPVRVSLSSTIGTPLVLGLDEVVLPFRAVHELSDIELEAVLAHEMAHLERRDTVWLWAALILERALWIQPLNRVATSRLRGLAECFCDDAAVRRTGSPEALATALTRVAEWIQARPATGPSLGMATSDSGALARVRRILDPRRSGVAAPRPLPAVLIAVIATAILVGLGPAFHARQASASPVPVPPHGPYTVSAFDDAGRFTITIDGARVIAATMNEVTVTADRIRQNGNRVLISSSVDGQSLDLAMKADGGFRWTSRRHPHPLPR